MSNNIYDFNFDEVSEEDIIVGAIQSDIAVFLHGRSSEGKSARVKQIDSDCEVIYLRNATPDSLCGKSVYNQSTGEMIDVKPSWLVKVETKSMAEPDKIHIVFFDELTNALPAIQNMAFNIILDREVNGKWRLPLNVRVVAAGNEIKDSIAANRLVEPLFNRFAHVYIETTVDAWLKWARTPKYSYHKLDYEQAPEQEFPIHPAIYSFIYTKKMAGIDILRTKYDGVKPNADPRKWEMASKMLFVTRKPEMIRSLVGEAITKDFVDFCKTKVVSVEDVISGNYDKFDYLGDVGRKCSIVLAMLKVSEEYVETVREFVKLLGLEYISMFDDFWTQGRPDRVELLQNLQGMSLKWVKK